MKKPDKFELDVGSIQATLDALDVIRDSFEKRSCTSNFSKKDLASWIDRDPSYVSRILNGRVSNVNYQTLARMLLALGYVPEFRALEQSELDAPANYKHCSDVEDKFSRVSSPSWRASINSAPDTEPKVSTKVRKFVVSNATA